MAIHGRTLACLLLVNVLFHLPYNAARATIQVLMLQTGAELTEIGMVSAIFAIPMLVGSVRIGRWIGEASTNRPTIIAIACLALGLMVMVAVPFSYRLLFSAALIGLGYCIWYIAVNACIGLRSFAEARLSNFSSLSLSFAVSSLISGVLVGSLDLYGWRAVMVVLLVGVLLGALIFAIGLAPLFDMPAQGTSNIADEAGSRSLQPRTRILGGLYAAMLLSGVAWDAILFGLPFLTKPLGGTPLLGACLSAFAGAAAFSRLCLTRLLARASIRARILLCLFTVASGMALIGVSMTGPLLMAAVTLSGMGLGLIKPCISDAVCAQSPQGSTASNLSVLPTLLALSAVVMPTAIGWSSESMPMIAWHLALAIAAMLLAAYIHRIWERP